MEAWRAEDIILWSFFSEIIITQGHTVTVAISLAKLLFFDAWDSCSLSCMKQCFLIPIPILMPIRIRIRVSIKTRQGHTEIVAISLAKLLFYDAYDCPHKFLYSKLHEAVFLDPNFFLDADPNPELSGLASKRCGSQADPTQVFFTNARTFKFLRIFKIVLGAFSAFSNIFKPIKKL